LKFTKLINAEQFTPIKQDRVPVKRIGDAAYFTGSTLCWVWCVFELDEDELRAAIYSEDPPPEEHWLPWEIDGSGLDCVLGIEQWEHGKTSDDILVEWLLTEGIAPCQPFLVAMSYKSFRHETYYGTEYDYEVYVDVMDIKPWPPELVLAAWEEHLKRIGMT